MILVTSPEAKFLFSLFGAFWGFGLWTGTWPIVECKREVLPGKRVSLHQAVDFGLSLVKHLSGWVSSFQQHTFLHLEVETYLNIIIENYVQCNVLDLVWRCRIEMVLEHPFSFGPKLQIILYTLQRNTRLPKDYIFITIFFL